MKALVSSEMSVSIYQSTRHNILKDLSLQQWQTTNIRIDIIIKTLLPPLPPSNLTNLQCYMYSISSFHMVHSSTEIACSLRMLYILLAVSKAGHKSADCLVVAVLTHGEGKNNLYAYDCAYKTDTLWSSFTADVCPQLAGKPKIFIIQVSVQSARVCGKCE